MSRNLYKRVQELEKRLEDLERENRYLQNAVSHLDTLLRIDRMPTIPTIPQTPWYKDPYRITCSTKEAEKLKEDPFVKLMIDTFKLEN